MALAETWLDDSIASSELNIPHFTLHRLDRSKRGGGVAVYIHECIPVVRRYDLERPDIELLWLELRENRRCRVVGCYYRPPSQNVDQWQVLASSIERVQAISDDIVIVGDFNVNMLDPSGHHHSHLSAIMSQFGLVNYVHNPTRVTSSSSSLIDLFLTTKAIVGACEVLKIDVSDHYAVLGRFLGGPSSPKRRALHRSRNLATVNWEAMALELRGALSNYTLSTNLDESVERWHQTVISVLDKHAPLKNRNRKSSRPCPWLTSELQQAVRMRNQLYKQLCQNPQDSNLREDHKAARRSARKLERTLRNQHFRDMCCTGNSKDMWRAINEP